MKKKYFVLTVFVIGFLLFSCSASLAAQQSMTVFQPKYNFEFAVYRTEDMPANWYKTYDDYYVSKGIDNNWIYGKQSPQGITATNILVGSVNPKDVKELAPSVAPAYIPPESQAAQPEAIRAEIQGVRPEINSATPMSDKDFIAVCYQGTPEEIEAALQNGVNINAISTTNGGAHAAVLAALYNDNYNEAIPILVKYGADINVRDYNGYTPLMSIAGIPTSPLERISVLVKYGADINAQEKNLGYTALIHAVGGIKPNPAIVAELLRNGADVNIKNRLGYTAYDVARTILTPGRGVKIPDSPEKLQVIAMLEEARKTKPSNRKRTQAGNSTVPSKSTQEIATSVAETTTNYEARFQELIDNYKVLGAQYFAANIQQPKVTLSVPQKPEIKPQATTEKFTLGRTYGKYNELIYDLHKYVKPINERNDAKLYERIDSIVNEISRKLGVKPKMDSNNDPARDIPIYGGFMFYLYTWDVADELQVMFTVAGDVRNQLDVPAFVIINVFEYKLTPEVVLARSNEFIEMLGKPKVKLSSKLQWMVGISDDVLFEMSCHEDSIMYIMTIPDYLKHD